MQSPDPANGNITLGLSVLRNFDAFANKNWYWIGAGALLAFTVLYNVLFTIALMYLNRKCSLLDQPFKWVTPFTFCLDKAFIFSCLLQ